MARIEFECRDKNGNMVRIVTAEMEMEKLIAGYDGFVAAIEKHGFSLSKGRGRPNQPKVKFDGKHCPFCKSDVYDNRERKQKGEYKPNAPDFVCSNKACTGGKGKDGQSRPWASWPDQYEIVDSP